jgi:hypothetical protein
MVLQLLTFCSFAIGLTFIDIDKLICHTLGVVKPHEVNLRINIL